MNRADTQQKAAHYVSEMSSSTGVALVLFEDATLERDFGWVFFYGSPHDELLAGSTYMAQLTTVKDVQAHLRHSSSAATLEHYIKSVPESVRVAVESLDHLLKKAPADSGQPAN